MSDWSVARTPAPPGRERGEAARDAAPGRVGADGFGTAPPLEPPQPSEPQGVLRALVVMHATTTMGRAGEQVWTVVDDRLAKRAANGLLTVLWAESPPEPEAPEPLEAPEEGEV